MIVWYQQEHQASCVAACIRMVLSAFDQHLPEAEIRRVLGNPRFGLTLGKAAHELIEANAIAQYYSDCGLDDLRDSLRAGNFPIVGIERRFFGYASAAHAVVLIAIHSSEVIAFDPLLSPESQVYQLSTLDRAWKSAGKEMLLLQSPLP